MVYLPSQTLHCINLVSGLDMVHDQSSLAVVDIFTLLLRCSGVDLVSLI
jgi:hypothetical protein